MPISLWIPVVLCIGTFLLALTNVTNGLPTDLGINPWPIVAILCSIATLIVVYLVPGDKRLLAAWIGTGISLFVFILPGGVLLALGLMGKGL